MKKFFVMLAMLTMTLAANAQFEKGKTFIGASLSGINLSYNGSEKFSAGINAQGGLFLKDNGLVFLNLGYRHQGEPKFNEFRAGLGGRYYIIQNGLFLGASLNYAHATERYNDFRPALELGYAFFVSREMTIEPALYYEQSFKNHSDFSTVGLKIGIGLYLPKNKIKDSVKEALKD